MTIPRNQKIYVDNLLNRGTLALDQGDLDLANQNFEKILLFGYQTQEGTFLYQAMHYLGQINFLQSEYKEAEKYWTQALVLAEMAKNPSIIAEQCKNIAKIYDHCGDFPQAWNQLVKALWLIIVYHLDDQLISILDACGTVLNSTHEYLDAIHVYKLALTKSEIDQNWFMQSVINNNLGIVFGKIGNQKKARKCFLRAIQLLDRCQDLPGLAIHLHNLAGTYILQRQEEKALPLLIRALEINEKANIIENIANNLNSLGLIYQNRGEWNRAMEGYLRGLRLLAHSDYKFGKSHIYYNIGLLYLEKQDITQAKNNFEIAINLMKEYGDLKEASKIEQDLHQIQAMFY